MLRTLRSGGSLPGGLELVEAAGDVSAQAIEVGGQQRATSGQQERASRPGRRVPGLLERSPKSAASPVSLDSGTELPAERERDTGLGISLWTKRHPDGAATHALPLAS